MAGSMSYNQLKDDEETSALRLVIPWSWLRRGTAVVLITVALLLVLVFRPSQATQSLRASSCNEASASEVHLWDPQLRPEFVNEPLGKKMVRYFDGYLMARAGVDENATFQANVNRALSSDVMFESIGFGPGGLPLVTVGRKAWTNSGEEEQFRKAFGSTELFTQMMFFGEDDTATTTSYGTLLWSGELFGIPAPNKWIELRVCDFYKIKNDPQGIHNGLITYNFMMIDWADVMHRSGHAVLPPATLEDGFVLPPSANDGVPAPFSILAQSRDIETARRVTMGILKDDWAGMGSGQHWLHQNITFYGPRGIGLARDAATFREHILKPFQAAFANRSLESEILTCEGNYCAACGHIRGVHAATWLGLTPTFKPVSIRYGMHYRIVGDKAAEGWALFDIASLFNQLGLDFFASAARGSIQSL